MEAAGGFICDTYLGFHEAKSESEYLGTRATHFDGELSGIARALRGHVRLTC